MHFLDEGEGPPSVRSHQSNCRKKAQKITFIHSLYARFKELVVFKAVFQPVRADVWLNFA